MIYLDNSATTQPCDAAVFVANTMMREHWHNPSALYSQAIQAQKRVEEARAVIAGTLHIKPSALVFTSGGTEADSLAILGAAARFRMPRRVLLFAGEHSAVLKTSTQLEAMGHSVQMIPATPDGILDLDAYASLLDAQVGLVSCMYVGNETGAMQPIEEIGRMLHAAQPDALLHVDGVQGYLRAPMDPARMGIDLLSISAHKVHGLKGVGALAVGDAAKLTPRVLGGGQEGGLRSGTENTFGIAAFGAAAGWIAGQPDVSAKLRAMKCRLYEYLSGGIPGLRVNGPDAQSEASAPHILNISFPGIRGEVMVHALEQCDVLVGTGAACASKKRSMSPAFAAMRAPAWAAENAVRFSFGLLNTMEEIEQAAQAVLHCHARYSTPKRR